MRLRGRALTAEVKGLGFSVGALHPAAIMAAMISGEMTVVVLSVVLRDLKVGPLGAGPLRFLSNDVGVLPSLLVRVVMTSSSESIFTSDV